MPGGRERERTLFHTSELGMNLVWYSKYKARMLVMLIHIHFRGYWGPDTSFGVIWCLLDKCPWSIGDYLY